MRLKNKVTVVTGAGSGIGAATARLLAKEGAKVVVADLDMQAAEAVSRDIGEASVPIAVDVRKRADAETMISLAVERFGGLDVLVNNAGRGMRGTVETMDEADWDDIISINLKSVYLCSKFAVPALRARGGGSIINIASNIATVGIRDRAAYVAAKGGVAALTRAMALDHAPEQIRVNSIAPGVIWSKYYERMLETVEDPEAFITALKARAPINRMGTPEEIAGAVLWLASDEASFATGSMFTIDGGMTAW
jgi:NAD(P)-dependent dehydrogenase (short-subunit alcohol dehydrogenase family)